MKKPLLDIVDLSLEFRTRSGTVHALQHVSLAVAKGETVGLVGESGSGKSVLSFALLGLSDKAARITGGSAAFDGFPLIGAREADLTDLRGREISMIFQNPKVALNPIRTVGLQIQDVLERHTTTLRRELRARAIQCLVDVKIPDPERRFHAYPFELSGGMCQRVMIALALACGPKMLIADEPTTGLDVTTQAAIMELIGEQARTRGMATLLITHDLALAAQSCDRIVVMHAGHVVESAPTAQLFEAPCHPYTRQLIAATPVGRAALHELVSIPGHLPDLRRSDLPACRFAERCTQRSVGCDAALPSVAVSDTHWVRCHHAARPPEHASRHPGESRDPSAASTIPLDPGAGEARPVLSLSKGRDDVVFAEETRP